METGYIPIEQMQNRGYTQAREARREQAGTQTAYSPNGQYHGVVIRVAIIYWLPSWCQELHTLRVMFSHYIDEDIEISWG